MTTSEKAIEILRRTRDGDDLSPTHLKLLELVVNGFASDTGLAAFEELYRDVLAGCYRQPWFHGIEHLTINHEGYVLWRRSIVEHYNRPWAYSEEAKQAAQEVARRCLLLERRGAYPTMHNVIWVWPGEKEQL